jgi:uncharacterized YigZ family protein
MKAIGHNHIYEYEIKKSRFIGFTFLVSSEEEIDRHLSIIRKEHSSATHVCYGYTLNSSAKCSDDGEPSGTAGLPILEVIKKNGLNNVLVVVVRYFGGIKLGAGGLIRAYSRCASDTIKGSDIKELKLYTTYRLEVAYANMPIINKMLKSSDYVIKNTTYANNIICDIGAIGDISKFSNICISIEKTGEEWL